MSLWNRKAFDRIQITEIESYARIFNVYDGAEFAFIVMQLEQHVIEINKAVQEVKDKYRKGKDKLN